MAAAARRDVGNVRSAQALEQLVELGALVVGLGALVVGLGALVGDSI